MRDDAPAHLILPWLFETPYPYEARNVMHISSDSGERKTFPTKEEELIEAKKENETGFSKLGQGSAGTSPPDDDRPWFR